MPNYQRLMKVLNLCRVCQRLGKFEPSISLHSNGRYDFVGVAAMLAIDLDPVNDDFKAKMSQSLIPSARGAQQYLELNMFEFALFWSYYRKPFLSIEELDDLICFVCTGKTRKGKPFERDGLTLTKKDLISQR